MPILLLYASSAACNLQATRVWLRSAAVVPALFAIGVLLAIWTREILIVDTERLRTLLDVLS